MQQQHTPGPWAYNPTNRYIQSSEDLLNRWGQKIGTGGTNVAELFGGTEADARLIAAAPDLLEALKELAFRAERHGMNTDEALAAIAKATQQPAPAPTGDGHASDCALHNAPALPVGPCDCGADPTA